MALFAILNVETGQMVGKPQPLPVRWTSPEGATIGSFNTLPRAVLKALGWLPVEHEALPSAETHRHAPFPVYDVVNARFVFRAMAKDLSALRGDAMATIDAAAHEAASRHLTVGPGMEMRYMEKVSQAREAVSMLDASPDADMSMWPILVAEASAVGESVETRAKKILAAYDAWSAIVSQVEAARIGGKTAISAATTPEAIINARDAALGALEAI